MFGQPLNYQDAQHLEATLQKMELDRRPAPPPLIGYPPAPSNGGALMGAPAKVGNWVWQPKIDDWRGVLHSPTGRIWNQYGERSAVEERGQLVEALALFPTLTGGHWWDIGIMRNRHDMMRGSIIVFDSMDSGWTHAERRKIMENNFEILPLACDLTEDNAHNKVYLINEWRNDHAGALLIPLRIEELLKKQNAKLGKKFYEGTVAKRADVDYPLAFAPKQKTPDWVKHRFDQ